MRYLFIIVSFCLVSACATKPKDPIVVTEYKYQVVTIPDTLLEKCSVVAPPEKTAYANSSDDEKEDILVTYTQNLLTDLDNCNSKISQIKSINDQYTQSYLNKK